MKLLRITLSLILVFCGVFTFIFGKSQISKQKEYLNPQQFKGVITLWHVDTFEGGQGSRKQFLLSVATQFEKQNDGVLVMVLSHTKESIKDSLDKGELPDLISYGAGVELQNVKELSLKQTFYGGMVGEKSYALAWCMGGYVLFTNPNLVKDTTNKQLDHVVVSSGELNQSLTALAMNGYTCNQIEELSPLEAYIKFVNGKTPYFLGTQRDIVRLENRGFNANLIPLEAYNDLYQYISVCSNNAEKQKYSQKFIEFLISEKSQKRLTEISMLSPYFRIKFDNSGHNLLQNQNFLSTISAFSSSELFLDLKEFSLTALKGDIKGLDKIKKVTLKP